MWPSVGRAGHCQHQRQEKKVTQVTHSEAESGGCEEHENGYNTDIKIPQRIESPDLLAAFREMEGTASKRFLRSRHPQAHSVQIEAQKAGHMMLNENLR